MEQAFAIASLWLGFAVVSAVVAYHLRISIALVEICVGVMVAAIVFGPWMMRLLLRFTAETWGLIPLTGG